MGANVGKKEMNPLCLRSLPRIKCPPAWTFACIYEMVFFFDRAQMNLAAQSLPCQSFITCFMWFSIWLCISCLYTFLSKCKCQNIILLLLCEISAGILSFTLRKRGQIHICYWERLLHIIWNPVHHSVLLWKKKHPQNHTQSKAIERNSLCKVMVFSTSHSGSWCLFCSKIMLLKDTC